MDSTDVFNLMKMQASDYDGLNSATGSFILFILKIALTKLIRKYHTQLQTKINLCKQDLKKKSHVHVSI